MHHLILESRWHCNILNCKSVWDLTPHLEHITTLRWIWYHLRLTCSLVTQTLHKLSPWFTCPKTPICCVTVLSCALCQAFFLLYYSIKNPWTQPSAPVMRWKSGLVWKMHGVVFGWKVSWLAGGGVLNILSLSLRSRACVFRAVIRNRASVSVLWSWWYGPEMDAALSSPVFVWAESQRAGSVVLNDKLNMSALVCFCDCVCVRVAV